MHSRLELPQAKCNFANKSWASIEPVVFDPSFPAGKVNKFFASARPIFAWADWWSYGAMYKKTNLDQQALIKIKQIKYG